MPRLRHRPIGRLWLRLIAGLEMPDEGTVRLGGVDMARLAKSIDQIADTYEFKNRPTAETIFTSEFLPPADQRKLLITEVTNLLAFHEVHLEPEKIKKFVKKLHSA
mgnify:CR=1 FL=1